MILSLTTIGLGPFLDLILHKFGHLKRRPEKNIKSRVLSLPHKFGTTRASSQKTGSAATPAAAMVGAATGAYGSRSEAISGARIDTSRWGPALGAAFWVPAAWVGAVGDEPPAATARITAGPFSGDGACTTADVLTASAPAFFAMAGHP